MFTLQSVTHRDIVAKMGCYLCIRDTASKLGPLIDFDMVIEGEGRLVICANCLYTAASILGFALPQDVEEAYRLVADQSAEITSISDRLNAALALVEATNVVKEHNDSISEEKKTAKRSRVAAAAKSGPDRPSDGSDGDAITV